MEARGLKKGPWTAAEDAILTEYVKAHGEGNWNNVQKNSGLLRCGKSCRLRWSNHLRPNLKKGSFSPDEEKIIVELHAKLGNKWARMASQLPGRTDNEIKNYWNTRMKRKQRSGLSLYPQEIHQQGFNEYDDNEFEFEFELDECNSLQFRNQDHHNHQNMTQYSNKTSSPLASYSSWSYQPSKRLRLDPLLSTNRGLNHISDSPMNSQTFSIYENSIESYRSMLMGDYEMRPSSLPLDLGNTFLELPSNQTLELPSNQTSTTPPFAANTILDNGVHLETPMGNNMGLIDALLEEYQALSRGDIFKHIRVSPGDLNTSHQSSSETNPNLDKAYNEPTMVKANVDDDDDDDLLMSLLNNYPSNTPLPDWYVAKIENEDNTLVEPHPSDGDTMASLGSCYWSNMPGIC